MILPEPNGTSLRKVQGKMILRVASETMPCRLAPKDRVIVAWWNKDCDKAVWKRKQAFRNLRKNPTQENAIE